MNYHAHIYFDLTSKEKAKLFRKNLQREFPKLRTSALIDKTVGPHLKPMFLIEFDDKDHDVVVRFINNNRGDLSALIHPLLDDELLAHTQKAKWLGEKVPLNLEKLD